MSGIVGEGVILSPHLSPKYKSTLYAVAYLQGLRMVVDRIHETGNIRAIPEDFSAVHDRCTRLQTQRFFGARAGCACADCADAKREIIGKARLRAVVEMRKRLMFLPGGGVAV